MYSNDHIHRRPHLFLVWYGCQAALHCSSSISIVLRRIATLQVTNLLSMGPTDCRCSVWHSEVAGLNVYYVCGYRKNIVIVILIFCPSTRSSARPMSQNGCPGCHGTSTVCSARPYHPPIHPPGIRSGAWPSWQQRRRRRLLIVSNTARH